jgi:RES domain-containing protein
MFVYRIAGKKHSDDLSGAGAAMYGGRWNKKGTPVLYTGESKEIALLETIVHTPPMIVPKLDIVTLEIPDDSITTIEIAELPFNWKSYPAPTILSELGESWIKEAKTIALRVPSCIIHSAYNLILNCRHIDYGLVGISSRCSTFTTTSLYALRI